MFVKEYSVNPLQDLFKALLTNTLGQQCPQLNVTEDLDARHQGLLEVLVHYWVTLIVSPHSDLLHPLTAMLQEPGTMQVENMGRLGGSAGGK